MRRDFFHTYVYIYIFIYMHVELFVCLHFLITTLDLFPSLPTCKLSKWPPNNCCVSFSNAGCHACFRGDCYSLATRGSLSIQVEALEPRSARARAHTHLCIQTYPNASPNQFSFIKLSLVSKDIKPSWSSGDSRLKVHLFVCNCTWQHAAQKRCTS